MKRLILFLALSLNLFGQASYSGWNLQNTNPTLTGNFEFGSFTNPLAVPFGQSIHAIVDNFAVGTYTVSDSGSNSYTADGPVCNGTANGIQFQAFTSAHIRNVATSSTMAVATGTGSFDGHQAYSTTGEVAGNPVDGTVCTSTTVAATTITVTLVPTQANDLAVCAVFPVGGGNSVNTGSSIFQNPGLFPNGAGNIGIFFATLPTAGSQTATFGISASVKADAYCSLYKSALASTSPIYLSPLGVAPGIGAYSQYNARASAGGYPWPNDGKSVRGDSFNSAWGPAGQFVSFNDGWGSATGTSGTGGCTNAGPLGQNIGLMALTFPGGVPLFTNINCMTSFGIETMNGSGICATNTCKSTGIDYINDSLTTTGLYWVIQNLIDANPWTSTLSTIMYSPDSGVTWCAPGHTGGSCNTNGDAPASGEFTAVNNQLGQFVAYEQSSTGTLNVDGNQSYIYMVAGGDYTNWILMRAARGSNLQTAASWQYYVGVVGGNPATSGNWQASPSGATVIYKTPGTASHLPNVGSAINHYPTITYVSGIGYLVADNNCCNDIQIFRSTALTGPYKQYQFQPVPLNGNALASTSSFFTYNFSQPLLSTLKATATGWTMQMIEGGSYANDNKTSTTWYGPNFFTLPLNSAAIARLQ